MFDGASNVKLDGDLFKKITQSWLLCVDLSIMLLFSVIMSQKFQLWTRWFTLIWQYMYILCQSYFIIPILYSNTCFYELHYSNIGVLSGNDPRIVRSYMGIQRDLCMRKLLLTTISSSELVSMSINFRISQAVSYINDNKALDRCYIILKTVFPYHWVLSLSNSRQPGMCKLYNYPRMINSYIQKSSYDHDNNDIFPVSILSPNIWKVSEN